MTRRTEKKLMQYTNIENVPSVEHLVSASMVSAVDKRNTNRRRNVKNKREQKSIRYETLLALTFTLINSLTPFPGRTVTCLKLGDIRSCILFQTKHLNTAKPRNKKQYQPQKQSSFLLSFLGWLFHHFAVALKEELMSRIARTRL